MGHAKPALAQDVDGINALARESAYDQAANWARDRFAEWGLSDARLEPFDFGRGWTLEKLSVEMTAPRYMPLLAFANACGDLRPDGAV